VTPGANWKTLPGDGYLASLKSAIRDELRADGCSQKDLAWFLGVSQKHVSNVLSGRVPGRFELVERMAAAVGLSPGFGRDGGG